MRCRSSAFKPCQKGVHSDKSGVLEKGMKSRCALLLFAFVWSAVFAIAQNVEQFRPSSVEVYFSPKGGVTDACVREINAAKKTIYVQAYSFTSAPIAKALVDASKRGVSIVAILDKSQKTERYSEADFLLHSGIPTFIDSKHAIAHNKIMILDGEVIITGSFNFTKSAEERNAENLLVIRDAKLAARYLKNFEEHKRHSEAYAGR